MMTIKALIIHVYVNSKITVLNSTSKNSNKYIMNQKAYEKDKITYSTYPSDNAHRPTRPGPPILGC